MLNDYLCILVNRGFKKKVTNALDQVKATETVSCDKTDQTSLAAMMMMMVVAMI